MTVAMLAACAGCQHGKYNYSGMEPSVRTFSDNAAVGDYYIGVDANFIVEDEVPHYRTPPTTRPISQY